MKFFRKRPWLSILFVFTAIAFAGFYRIDELTSCVVDWADKNTKRNEAISSANRLWRDGLDELVRSVASQDRMIFKAKYDAFISASNSYKDQVNNNPIPESPRLAC